jgi:polar amino acid transport system ATP-binding protein
MFIVSHEMGFVKEISNKVAFLDKGKVIEMNNPDKLFNHPENQRTRDFMMKIIKE